MPSQVKANSVPQVLSCRSNEHTARNAFAGGAAGYFGVISGLMLVVIDHSSKQYIQTIFGDLAIIVVPTIVASGAVGTTAWILSRMNQRQAENATSLESRNIKPLISSSKY